ncbi:MAG: hypothetical protein JST26_17650 [Bacteroidetes bacterium]|nr:hypothetical protein [Bacteroidota bacterium]
MKIDKKVLIVVAVSVCIVLMAVLLGIHKKERINEGCFYTIAKVDEIINNSDGLSYTYRYKYRNQEFSGGVTSLDIHTTNSFMLIRFSIKDPKINEVVEQKLPIELAQDSLYGKTWEQIPAVYH